MKIPSGFNVEKGKVCKLKKPLYGLKQAPRAWNNVFDEYIKSLGFQQSKADKCLYTAKHGDTTVYLLLYVDDIIIAGNNMKRIEDIRSALKTRFYMTDSGELHSFLRIAVSQDRMRKSF